VFAGRYPITEGKFVRAETRHQLKQDTFSRATLGAAESAAHWTVEHQSKLIVVGIIAAVLVAGGLGGWYYLSQQDQKASLELNQAIRMMDAPLRSPSEPAQPDVPSFTSGKDRATEARKRFEGIVNKYPRTRSGEVARYFLGRTSSDLGDNATAERELKQVASSRDSDLAALAKLSLAAVYRNTNRNPDALALYKQISEKPTEIVSKAMAQLEMAATYQAMQQPDEAKRIYQQVQKDNPSTEIAEMAGAKLAELK
jgi:predicted negative regulator of RcsB-dependent stress response